MTKEEIIVLGRGGHAQCVINIIEEQDKYKIIGVTDVENGEDSFMGYPLLGSDDVLPDYLNKGVKNVALGVGGFTSNDKRATIYERVKKLGFYLPPIVHPSAIISRRSKIGEGAMVFPGVILDEVTIGVNNLIGTASSIDHGSVLGDHVLVSAGVTIGAETIIGNKVLCALGCKVISGVNVADDLIIGAGAVVVKNLIEKGTYMGCPAKRK